MLGAMGIGEVAEQCGLAIVRIIDQAIPEGEGAVRGGEDIIMDIHGEVNTRRAAESSEAAVQLRVH